MVLAACDGKGRLRANVDAESTEDRWYMAFDRCIQDAEAPPDLLIRMPTIEVYGHHPRARRERRQAAVR